MKTNIFKSTLIITLILFAASALAFNPVLKSVTFNTEDIVDIQTTDGEIFTPQDIKDGFVILPSITVTTEKLSISFKDNQHPVKDIQLADGTLVDPVCMNGGDMGGGGKND